MKRYNLAGLTAAVLIVATVLMTGCSSKNKLPYFVDTEGVVETSLIPASRQLLIQPNDELLINISSDVPQATVIYNLPLNNPAMSESITESVANSKQLTYIVDRNGYITMPILGKIHVAGMTTTQLADDITARVAQDVDNPYVRVQIVNFNINVIGEVKEPGQYTFSTERVSVLDALAKAGDMTIYGKRHNVLVMREEGGKLIYHRVDLNDSKIAESPYYYLQQNDVVYVEPVEARKGQSDFNQNNSYKISVVSAIVSGASVVASLLIALLASK